MHYSTKPIVATVIYRSMAGEEAGRSVGGPTLRLLAPPCLSLRLCAWKDSALTGRTVSKFDI